MGLLNDIAALAKAGYTVAEVRELMQLAQDPEQTKKPEPETTPKEEEKPEPEKLQEPEKKEKASSEPSKDPAPLQSLDQSKEIEELKKQLAAAQAENRKQDRSENVKSSEDLVKDLVLSFM